MKIKTWLMITYFIIMLLPVVSAYFFYSWLESYYKKQEFIDYINVQSSISKLEQQLHNPSLFLNPDSNKKLLETLLTKDVAITLYNMDGNVLYTNLADTWSFRKKEKEELFQDLYKLQIGLRAHTIKKPVFLNGTMIGVYEISITRGKNIQNMESKRNMIIFLFFCSFVLIYIFMIALVKRKLTLPLKKLMTQMRNFGAGEKVEALEARNDEIGELILQFEKMKNLLLESQKRIRETQKEKQFMIATISHDLKTPLTSIRAYSESLRFSSLTDEEKKEYLGIIMDKADYMKQMFDELTMFTLLQNNDDLIEKVEVDTEELFDMLFSGYEEVCKQKDILLTIDIRVTGLVYVNFKQLTRVIDNLFSNALYHTDVQKQIWLGAYSPVSMLPEWIFSPFKKEIEQSRQDYIIFIVQNEGRGIEQDQLEKVFEPLYQVETARTKKSKGTGLGLSISKMIIEKHGGTIHAFSKEGFGTTFVCRLPYQSKGEDENEMF